LDQLCWGDFMKRIIVLLCATLLMEAGSPQAMAAAEATVTPAATLEGLLLDASEAREDVYIRLYRYRLERQRILVEQRRQDLAIKIAMRQRREKLYETNAISAEELEAARRDVELAALQVEEQRASVFEAEAMLEIATDRVSLGLDMPICVEMQ